MNRWIALLRGINVGGNNSLPMAELRSNLESLQLSNVRTYIQSGNAIFDAVAGTPESLAAKIQTQIEKKHGFRPHVLILGENDLRDAIKSNPFPEATDDPKSLHLLFLENAVKNPDLKALDKLKTATERFKLTGRVFYLHAPDGIARSRLAANATKLLGVVGTARNYRTVDKIITMAMQN